jgi:hypothetical protein
MDSSLWTILLPLLVALLASGLAIAWVVRPLYSEHAPAAPPADDRLASLVARKDAVLVAIRDLEFDHKLGKLTEEDFARYDARLRRQAIALLQQIEQIAPSVTDADDEVEAEIARRRRHPHAATTSE